MVQPDKIIRSNRKTLALSVDSFGRLIVRAPKRYSEERIFAFIREKEGWIVRKQAEKKGAGAVLPPENLDGYTFLLLGKSTKIIIDDGKKVGCDGEQNIIYLPREKSQDKLVKWLKENAKRILTMVTEKKAKEMGVSYSSIAITSAKPVGALAQVKMPCATPFASCIVQERL
jgi:predicted metal-dependent hydrolase